VTGLRRQAKNFHHVFSRWDTIPDRDRQMSDGQTSCNSQCCVKDLRLKDEDKDEDLKIGPRGQGFSSRTTTLLWGSTVRSTWTWTWPGHNGK